LDHFENNLFLIYSEDDSFDLELYINKFKYDLEITLALPVIFLNKQSVIYEDSVLNSMYGKGNVEIRQEKVSEEIIKKYKELSVIVPIHNNGRYLKYKCFRSLKRLSCYEEIEIIFVDDGSTDPETLRIIKDISDNNDIVLKRYDEGSGSASRPRNEGISIATTDLITYLDPDNEAVYDGYSLLLDEMKSDKDLDMVVGDIVREDNIKRNVISYSSKVKNALKSDIIIDTKETLIKTKLTVQSIQGLIVKNDIIYNNNFILVVGVAVQVTFTYK